MNNYLISIQEDSFTFNQEDLEALDIISIGDSQYHSLSDLKSYDIKVIQADFPNKLITVEVNGNTYPLKLQDQYDQMVDKLGMLAAKSQQINKVKAPMPGLIIDIMATVGQEVSKGTPLLVLSAMKMENIITSPGQGVIKRIEVKIDDAVVKGQILIEME
ncbi:Na(+)-translocating NADH-quinone reductase subunit A [Arenibacter antarcticus]|uniref:Acetyl-CoA carboxylase biotin carboxyl carrier protein subunit n=1 Tax=Arenibacter antarcticus TaxID=2040469 RepID=A0ABW5VL02_9FLAO|nr:acetyl-CoA carboxylase biotin carboxyl carrier protein subunit [Arenibacter sp. H213]